MVLLGENRHTENTMPTIDDVAKLANVSRATVSRVLTGTRGVREDSREAVLKAVEVLDYRPSFAAQTLASNTSGYIGMVLPAHEASFSATLLPRLSLAVKALNKSLLIQYVNDENEQKAAIHSLHHQCAAVVTLSHASSDMPANVIAFDAFSTKGSANQGYNYAFAAESAILPCSLIMKTTLPVSRCWKGIAAFCRITRYRLTASCWLWPTTISNRHC